MKSVPVEQTPPFRAAKLKFFVKYLKGAFKYFMGEKRIIFGPWSMDHSPWLFWVDFGDYRLLTGSPLPNHGLPSSSCHGPWTNSSSCYGPWTMDYGLWTMDYGLWTMDFLTPPKQSSLYAHCFPSMHVPPPLFQTGRWH